LERSEYAEFDRQKGIRIPPTTATGLSVLFISISAKTI